MRRIFIILLVCLLSTAGVCGHPLKDQQSDKQAEPQAEKPAAKDGIHWEPWSDDVFERAKRENRLVILDLEAIWCHWCHVMSEITYQDPEVIRLIKTKYIAVRVDQDSRPDLSNRYEDYGWPATILFDSKGGELALRSGYIPPSPMASMLQAFVDDPTPGPSVTAKFAPTAKTFSDRAFLTEALRKELFDLHLTSYDQKYGGWGFIHKYLEWDSVEYSMVRARGGDLKAQERAKKTLAGELNLIDPAWGGVYQYSTGGKWDEPHFEKIMTHNAENMRIYAMAYAMWKDPTYLKAAEDIHRFLRTFLTGPEGAFYTSQDADLVQGEHSAEFFALSDAERRKRGIPRVDTHSYARENGWVINSLATLYGATGDQKYLDEAVTAAKWVLANRSLPDGGFRHDAADPAGPYMGDSISMARAFLNLYGVTGNREWLAQAEATANFIAKTFAEDLKDPKGAGFVTTKVSGGLKSVPQRDENIAMARFANLLFQYTGNKAYRELAERAMRFLVTREMATFRPVGGTLLVDLEMATEPVHIAIVGKKDDALAQSLFRSAISFPVGYKRVEWLDRREGPLPNPDVQYPDMKTAAAFACADKRCSLPVFKPEDVHGMVNRLSK